MLQKSYSVKQFVLIVIAIIFTGCSSEKEKIVLQNLETIEKYITSQKDSNGKEDEIIKSSYIAEDVLIINEILNKVSERKPFLDEFIKTSDDDGNEEDSGSDVGFNLKIANTVLYGGYGNFYISILHYKSDVLYMKIDISFTSQDHEFIKEYIIKHISFPIICTENGISYLKMFQENYKKYREEKSFPLYLTNDVSNIPAAYQENYQLLVDPSNLLSWGSYCGDGPGKTLAKIAIDHLTDNKQFKLVENILYSSNVVGRVYALQALEKWNANGEYILTENAKSTIKEIKALDIKFYVCDFGCVVQEMNFRELSKIRRVDINVVH